MLSLVPIWAPISSLGARGGFTGYWRFLLIVHSHRAHLLLYYFSHLVDFNLIRGYKKNGSSTGIRQVSFPSAGYPLLRLITVPKWMNLG